MSLLVYDSKVKNDSMRRMIKRIAIALIFFSIIGGIAFLIYISRPLPVASCSDGIRNQGEIEVDCGGPCKSCQSSKELILFEVKAIPTTKGFVDLFAELKNDNLTFGIPSLRYTFELYDKDDVLLTKKQGVTFILPNSSKYIIEQAVAVKQMPDRVKFIFEKSGFKEVKDYIKPRLAVLNITSTIDEAGFLRVRGIVGNQTNLNFNKVSVVTILRDDADRLIAINRHEIHTLLSNENRFFEMTWAYRIPFFSKIENQVDTNIFDESNVIKFFQ